MRTVHISKEAIEITACLVMILAVVAIIFVSGYGNDTSKEPQLASEQIVATVHEVYDEWQIELLRNAIGSNSYRIEYTKTNNGDYYALVEFWISNEYEIPTMEFLWDDGEWKLNNWTWNSPDAF